MVAASGMEGGDEPSQKQLASTQWQSEAVVVEEGERRLSIAGESGLVVTTGGQLELRCDEPRGRSSSKCKKLFLTILEGGNDNLDIIN